MSDSLGDRMKEYETCFDIRLPHRIPLIIRLDGRSFHSVTKSLKLQKPMDEAFHRAMVKTAIFLGESINNARFVYTQSDEISILIYPKFVTAQPWFDNRLVKLISASASLASVQFTQALLHTLAPQRSWPQAFIEITKASPTFDSRVFVVPPHDVPNVFIWRQRDAMKNSVSAFAQHHFTRAALHKKNSRDRIQMLRTKGVEWEKLPSWQRWGTGAMRRNYIENDSQRSRWEPIEIPNFSKDPGIIKQFLAEPTMPQ